MRHQNTGFLGGQALQIQPIEFAEINCLTASQYEAVKRITGDNEYTCRKDIEGAICCARLMLDLSGTDWIKDLPMTSPKILSDYTKKWQRARSTFSGTSIAERVDKKLPVILPGVYGAVNRLTYMESAAIELITWEPTRSSLELAVVTMHKIISPNYPAADNYPMGISP